MPFVANGIDYLLTFNPNEGLWQLLTATPRGISRIRIFDDGGPLVVPTEVEVQETEVAN